MQLNTFLTFNGNCREAMNFYKKCLGGELTFQTIGESPMAEKMPKQMKNCILHAQLTNDQLHIMGSDMVPKEGLIKGNAVSMSLHCSSEKEIKKLYKKLSEEGTPTHPIEKTFFGSLLGGLRDKYGHHWLLIFENKTNTLSH